MRLLLNKKRKMSHHFRTHRSILHDEIFLLSVDQVTRRDFRRNRRKPGGKKGRGLVFSSPEKRTKPIAPGRVSGTGDRKVSNPDFHSLVTLTRVDRATLCTRLLKFPGGCSCSRGNFSKKRRRREFDS